MATYQNWIEAVVSAQKRYDKAIKELREASFWLRHIKVEKGREEKRKLRNERKARNAKAREERSTRLRKFRRSRGLCVKCGLQALPSKYKNSNGWMKYCAAHRESQLRAQRKRTGAKPRASLQL